MPIAEPYRPGLAVERIDALIAGLRRIHPELPLRLAEPHDVSRSRERDLIQHIIQLDLIQQERIKELELTRQHQRLRIDELETELREARQELDRRAPPLEQAAKKRRIVAAEDPYWENIRMEMERLAAEEGQLLAERAEDEQRARCNASGESDDNRFKAATQEDGSRSNGAVEPIADRLPRSAAAASQVVT